MRDVLAVADAFAAEFGAHGRVSVFFAPGRVNLIGDHIDYSGGLVLPMALDRGTLLLARPREDTVLRAVSLDRPGMVTADVQDTGFAAEHGWFSYVLGVLHTMGLDSYQLDHGLDVMVAGDLPDGAGLSSSASLELAAGVAFESFGRFGLSPTELALIGQRTENDYIGVSCGIMDQLAVAKGVAGHALLMDCAEVSVTPVPFPDHAVSLVIANTNHRRSLTGSAYNDRRADVERAAALFGGEVPLVAVELATLMTRADDLDEVTLRRARHTITEQARVVAAAAALAAGDLATVGELMRESHESVRDDFDVTGPELDAIGAAAWAQPGVIGARMTGAGFGGCAVVLVTPGAEAEVIDGIERDYLAAIGSAATATVMHSDDGARKIGELVVGGT